MRGFYLLCLISVVSSAKAMGQSDIITMKAAFMERFTRFIEWPASVEHQDSLPYFTILMLDKSTEGKTIGELLSVTTIKGKKVKVIYSDDIQQIKNCQMVYISSSFKRELDKILALSRLYPVLPIGDTEGYAGRGVLINFFVEEDILRFELNVKEFQKSQLKVSHLLINYAKTIEDPSD